MRALPALAALTLLAACGGASPDPGLDRLVRVRGAQWVAAALPPEGSGPAVSFVDVRAPNVLPGEGAVRVSGRAAPGAWALNLATDREDSHWVLPVGLPDSEVPQELSWEALLDFSRALAPGPLELRVQAAGASGEPGPLTTVALEVLPLVPPGALVVTLEWDANVDADLLVVDPAGVTLGGKNLNTWSPPPPGSPPGPPGAANSGGVLDQDSNANCVLDGRRRENAVWSQAAPAGHYRVLVALARTCGLGATRFQVTVRREGEVLTSAGGALYASDALAYPDEPQKAAGVLALEFDLP